MGERTKGEVTSVQYVGDGVWIAHLDQDAVEDILQCLVIAAQFSPPTEG